MPTPETPVLERLSQFNPTELGYLESQTFYVDYISDVKSEDNPTKIEFQALLWSKQYQLSLKTAREAEGLWVAARLQPDETLKLETFSKHHQVISDASGLGYDHQEAAEFDVFALRIATKSISVGGVVDLYCTRFSLIYGVPKAILIPAMKQRVKAFENLHKQKMNVIADWFLGEGEAVVNWENVAADLSGYYALLKGAIKPQRAVTA